MSEKNKKKKLERSIKQPLNIAIIEPGSRRQLKSHLNRRFGDGSRAKRIDLKKRSKLEKKI